MKLNRSPRHLLPVVFHAVLFSSLAHSQDIRLTAINCFSCNPDGTFDRINYWNTRAGGSAADLFVIEGGLGETFINAGVDRSVDLTLFEGEYTFTLHADAGSDFPYFGINLYFGGNIKPDISAFVPLRRSLDQVPGFLADGREVYNGSSDVEPGFTETGAGTLSTRINLLKITLTEFWWAQKILYKQDRVGTFSGGPDGSLESVAQFKLKVEDDSVKFSRGDANADGAVDVSDAVVIFFALFFGEGEIACRDGADSNDNGAVDISDGIFTLTYKFLGGVTISPPAPESCGLDPTEDELDCQVGIACR